VNEETSYEKWGGVVRECYINWTYDGSVCSTQDVPGGIVNILGGCSMDYSE